MTPVTLRDVVEADLPALYAWHTDPVSVHMAAFRIEDPDIDAFRARWARIIADPDVFKKTIEYDGVVAGSIGCFVRDDKREIGYWIDRGFWGRGIASAALAQFLATIDARPLYARIAKDNIGSCRVVEKSGFAAVETVRMFEKARGEGIDEVLYELR